jgi:hypothetical protein
MYFMILPASQPAMVSASVEDRAAGFRQYSRAADHNDNISDGAVLPDDEQASI